jgi:hypothetical protein
MQTVAMLAGGGLAMAVYPKLPAVLKAAIIIGLIVVSAIEMNKTYWESFYASNTAAGAASEGDSKTANLKAAQRDLAEDKPVAGAVATAAVNLAEHSAAAQERQAIADAASESEETLLAKVKHHKPLSSAENLRVSEIRQRRAEATTAELVAQANAAWQPFNLRLAHQLATGTVPGDDLFQFFENASRSHR